MTSEVMVPERGAMLALRVKMSSSRPHQSPLPVPVGVLLREWRAARRLSQLDLALEAEVSTRHLSCVETGKSQPSRELIARLAGALAIPPREQNILLRAAGFSPRYAETELAAPELSPVRSAIELIVEHQEPYPAFVLNRHWEILRTNRAAVRMAEYLIGGSAHSNMMRQFFDPQDLRAVVANWEEVARDLIRHLHDAIAVAPHDEAARALLGDLLRYPDVPADWRTPQFDLPPSPLLTVDFRKGNEHLRFFSTITAFATSHDVTLDELRIECAFPADDVTAAHCRTLADTGATPRSVSGASCGGQA